MTDHAPRFARQTLFRSLGKEGQARLEEARVLVVGCGALGGVLAQSLTRSGVGTLVLVDRDVVEESNLPRQVLFEDKHAKAATPKVEAAVETLSRIGGPTRFEPHALHLGPDEIEDLGEGCALVLDGTDNLSTRYLINDWSVREGVPWVYGGVVGSGGLVMPVLPGEGPCLRCLFPEAPPPGTLPTCDTAGVLQPAVGAVASLQAGLALRILGAEPGGPPLEVALCELDVWRGEVRRVRVSRSADCPCCGRLEFDFLDADGGRGTLKFCGRNAVQVLGRGTRPDFERLAASLGGVAKDLRATEGFLRFEVEEARVTVFPDGRALIEGTEDEGRARALYDRFLGA